MIEYRQFWNCYDGFNIQRGYYMHIQKINQYGLTYSDIDKKVIRPILTECSLYFKNLKLTKIKRGKTISRFKFVFKTKKEKTLSYMNGEQVVADNRTFDEIIIENETREEFESLDINEQVKLIRKQLLKSNNV